jgi:hypothetical protein
LCEAVESKATAYMMPNPRLAIRDGNQDGLDPDIFGPPAFVVTLKDTAGSGLGRTVLPVARYFSGFELGSGLGFPRSAGGTGAALVEYSTDQSAFSLVCSPAVLSMRDRGRIALLVPALSVWRPHRYGENILSERLTIPVGFVVADEDVRRMSAIEVELGKRVPLFRK